MTERLTRPEVTKSKDIYMPRKFYTAFVLWAQDGITNETLMLHCTHKYLGEQDENAMGAVVRIIAKYMDKSGNGGWPRVNFTERAVFNKCTCSSQLVSLSGERLSSEVCEPCNLGLKPISVLKSADHRDGFWSYLRSELDGFRPDDFADYVPHIAVEHYPEVTGVFQAYGVMSGGELLNFWRNPHWEKAERIAQRRQKMAAVKGGKSCLEK